MHFSKHLLMIEKLEMTLRQKLHIAESLKYLLQMAAVLVICALYCRSLCVSTSWLFRAFFFQRCHCHPLLEDWTITAHMFSLIYTVEGLLPAVLSMTVSQESLWFSTVSASVQWADGYSCHTVFIHLCSYWFTFRPSVCISLFPPVFVFCFFSSLYLSLHISLFIVISVISVEALSDCTDVRLSVHPDLPEYPLPLL